jgi:hypothetical protein
MCDRRVVWEGVRVAVCVLKGPRRQTARQILPYRNTTVAIQSPSHYPKIYKNSRKPCIDW